MDNSAKLDLPNVFAVDSLPITPNKVLKQSALKGMLHLNNLSFPAAEEALILIGMDNPDAFIVEEVRRERSCDPVVFKIPLGWALTGPVSQKNNSVFPVNFVQSSDQSLHQKLECMWKMDFEDTNLPSTTGFHEKTNLLWRFYKQV